MLRILELQDHFMPKEKPDKEGGSGEIRRCRSDAHVPAIFRASVIRPSVASRIVFAQF